MVFLAFLGGCFLLAACVSNTQPGPAQAVEAYLQALVNKDADKMISASCSEWESSARTELEAFTAVSASLDGLSCKETGKEGEKSLVQCDGKIVASYGGENQEFPLQGRTYQVVQQSGDWRMCGYK
jgi:predicted small secreted protein